MRISDLSSDVCSSDLVVLVHGHEGTAAAGHVIEAFGQVLIGGDYVVGLFVFVVLMIINLVVITKGAGRVSEVSARFTLDALPGKQMAIDRSEEHTSELQSLMRISYAVFCLKKKNKQETRLEDSKKKKHVYNEYAKMYSDSRTEADK